MKTILLIRHGMTKGNAEKRYIGLTDQPICDKGIEQAMVLSPTLPPCDTLFCSPLLRCRQTAELLFPSRNIKIIEDFREFDFGYFEGKTADELEGDLTYTEWLNSGCRDIVPGGEDVSIFKKRCCLAFCSIVAKLPECSTAAFVLHGGVIMAIMERFAEPKREFYDYHIENCQCLCCTYEAGKLSLLEKSKC